MILIFLEGVAALALTAADFSNACHRASEEYAELRFGHCHDMDPGDLDEGGLTDILIGAEMADNQFR